MLQPAFTLLSFSSVVDVLRHAADEKDHSRQVLCRWRLAGNPDTPIRASCGLEVRAEEPFASIDLADLDYVIVVGGLMSESHRIDPDAVGFLRAAREAGVGLVGLCSGFIHLARAGLLAGRRCCIHWVYDELLTREHPDITPVHGPAYVEDDGIFTAIGGIASLELALDLVERHCGRRRARKCIDRLCIEATFASRRATAAIDRQFEVSGVRYLEWAVEAMRLNIERPMNITTLARLIGVSDRHLRGVFRQHTGRSPARFWRDMRFHEAKWRLANTAQSITQIAYATGFADSGHLSRVFRNTFDIVPHAFRDMQLRASRLAPDETRPMSIADE